MRQKNARVEDLKILVAAFIKAGQAETRELMAEVLKEYGPDGMEANMGNLEVEGHYADWISSVFASRLKNNSCPMLWFSHWHYTQFVVSKLDAIAAAEGVVLEKKDRRFYGKLLKDGLRKSIEIACRLQPDQGKNIYKEYWCWIKAAYAEAEAIGMTIGEFIATDKAIDSTTRRVLSREQYADCYERQCSPLLESLNESGFTRKEVKGIKKIIDAFYKKRIYHIYGK